jgi:Tol biopolymer transport system component
VNPGAWLPDGTAYVGGVKDQGAPGDIWLVPRTGGTPMKIVGTPSDELAPSVSPDGKWVAYQSNETGRVEIYVRGLDGRAGRAQVSNMGGSEPVWDPNSARLYYIESAGDRKRLLAADLRTSPGIAVLGRAVVLSDVRLEESDNHANYDLHPDGSRFVMPDVEAPAGLVAVFDWARSLASAANR